MLKLPSIIGHRGACGYAPENTLVSFEAAVTSGVCCIEFDVRLTADNELVIIHDDTLDRTTSGNGPVGSLTLGQIKELEAGRWFSVDFTGTSVPTLREAIDFLIANNLIGNLEIKPSPGLEEATARAVCAFINFNYSNRNLSLVISSFTDHCLNIAMSELPQFERALVLKDFDENWLKRAKMVQARSIHIWHGNLSQGQARSIIDAGYPLRSFTVNDNELAKKLYDWGLQSVFTDYPDRITHI